MTEGTHQRLGFSAIGDRKAKAEKIAAILAAAGRPLNPRDNVLDLGCDGGKISARLDRLTRIGCADPIDRRTQGTELRFHPVGDTLPLFDKAFDVICNRVKDMWWACFARFRGRCWMPAPVCNRE